VLNLPYNIISGNGSSGSSSTNASPPNRPKAHTPAECSVSTTPSYKPSRGSGNNRTPKSSTGVGHVAAALAGAQGVTIVAVPQPAVVETLT